LDDSQLRPRFAGMDAAALKASQTAFLTAAFGGPATAHPSQPAIYLDDEQFGRFVLHIYETLLSLGIPDIFTEQLVLAVMTRALSGDAGSEVTAGPSNTPTTRPPSSLALSL